MSSSKKAKKEKRSEPNGEEKGVLKLFKGIFEHNVDETVVDSSKDRLIAVSGFPVAPVREQDLIPITSHNKKKSIFAQQFERSGLSSFGLTRIRREVDEFGRNLEVPESLKQQLTHESVSAEVLSGTDESSSVMEWSSVGNSEEMKIIDEENQKRIDAMTETEILAEQRNILESSDPLMSMMASYLKNRKQKNEVSNVTKDNVVNYEPRLISDAKSEINVDDLPIKPKPEWIHMDQMEHEKLAWMKDLPLPATDNQQTGQPARFDFAGNLVAPESDVPVHLGLHHHGDDPERAGYSLQELFQLSRSSNLQQRAIALTTMGRVIRNARRGVFYDRLSTAVIPSLLDGGLVFLLRWALDDNAQSSIVASVGVLHSLLVSNEDEIAADRVFCWHGGSIMPSLQSYATEEKSSKDDQLETDAIVVKNDVIKGLLRMFLPERLRYLLEVCRPASFVVIQIIEILIRLARHSSEAAYQVFRCPRLIDVIVSEFLPSTWMSRAASDESLPSVFGFPLATAVKLIRVLCSSGRNIAAFLLSKYNILRYVVEEPNEMDLPFNISCDVCLESWRLWIVLLQYGLTLNIYCDFYHIIMERLRKLNSSQVAREKRLSSLGCTLLGAVEATVHCAAEVTRRSESSARGSRILESDDDVRSSPVIPVFSWSPVSGLFPLFSEFSLKNLRHFTDFYFNQPYDLDLATASVNLLASYYSRIRDQPQYNPLNVEKEIIALCSDQLMPCLSSRSFSLSLQYVRNCSMFDSEQVNSNENIPVNIKTLGALTDAKAVTCPVLDRRSTVAFLVSLSRLLIALGKLNRSIVEKTFCMFLSHEEMLQYVRKVCRVGGRNSLAKNYFSRFECEFQSNLVHMAQMKGFKESEDVDAIDITLYHYLALNLLLHLNSGDEYLCHCLVSSVLFNIEFLCDLSLSEEMGSEFFNDRLHLNVNEPLTNATQQKFSISKSDLFKDLTENLPSMRSTYLTSAPVNPSDLVHSRNCWLHNCLDCRSLLCGVLGQPLVPVDWVFLPLIQVHNRNLDPNTCDDRLLPGLVTKVKDSLRMLYLLETARPNALKDVSTTVKLSRLMFTFLAGNDLFLDKIIHGYLAELLKIYCLPKHLDKIDFTTAIPGISSFHDQYRQLVTQYESVSFGDSLFACYLLLPLQQQHSVSLRVVLWDENVAALRSIFISVKELIIPVERFLHPPEDEVHLLRLYFQALFSETIIPNRCPLPYLIAVHHINRFIYAIEKTHQKLRHDILKVLLASDNKELRHHLLYYKNVNVECNNSIELYNELPAQRQKTLEAFQESSLLT